MAQMLSFHTHTSFAVEHILGITQHWRIEKCLKLEKKKRHSNSNKLNLIQTDIKVVQVFKVSDVSCNRTTDDSGRHTMHYSLHSWYHKVSLPAFASPVSAGYLRHCQAHVLNLQNLSVSCTGGFMKLRLGRITGQPHAVQWYLAAV